MDTYWYADEEGERNLGVVAEYPGHDWTGRVLHDVEAFNPWLVVWTDGVNEWVEPFLEVHHALARLAALVVAAEAHTGFVQRDLNENPAGRRAFEDEVERFVSRVVHASSCQPGCDGTNPANHQV